MTPSTAATPRLPDRISQRLRLPLIAAPMLKVSGVDLVVAACRHGVVGAFPTVNARSTAQLDQWLGDIRQRLFAAPEAAAPFCPNLIMRSPRLAEDLACLLAHRVEMVITSVGSPAPVVDALHGIGCLVLADVATLAHARKAIAAGADGLVLLSAGAGGQTGWLNPLAFVRALRAEYDGPLVLAGGVSDGVALRAAQVLGADLAYMGTRFIATHESLAQAEYKQMLVASSADDVLLTRAFTGLPTSMLVPSIERMGLDPARLDEQVTPQTAAQMFGGTQHRANAASPQAGNPAGDGPRRWSDIWSAGHSVSGVHALQSVEALVAELEHDYHHALG
jgi:nitronate monooxygenase